MIKSFKDKQTAELFSGNTPKKFSAIEKVATRKLQMLDAAITINDLRVPPANHLEALIGDRKGQYCIRINAQFRLCFVWEGQNAFDVEIVDYH